MHVQGLITNNLQTVFDTLMKHTVYVHNIPMTYNTLCAEKDRKSVVSQTCNNFGRLQGKVLFRKNMLFLLFPGFCQKFVVF